MSRPTVITWRGRYEAAGVDALGDLERSGRPGGSRRRADTAQIVQWELQLQQQVADALEELAACGQAHLEIRHPTKDRKFASVDLETTVEPGDGYTAEAMVVEVSLEQDYRGTNLAWTMTTRLLTCLCPPAQDWDRYGDTMSALADVGHTTDQAARLRELTVRGELCRSIPGNVSHWAHQKNLAKSTVEGRAVRALCGAFFVPFQDHEPADLPRVQRGP